MLNKIWWFVIVMAIIAAALVALNYFTQRKHHENFAMETACVAGLDTLLKRSMKLEDGGLPADLTTKCIQAYDFKLADAAGLTANSSVLTMLFNLFQTRDNDKIPYIARFYDWKYMKDNTTETIISKAEWDTKFETNSDNQKASSLAKHTLIPIIRDLCKRFIAIKNNVSLEQKYNDVGNRVNKAFINGFLNKYSKLDDGSSARLISAGTEENAMFKALVENTPQGYTAAIKSKNLNIAIADFASLYLLNVNFTANSPCTIDIVNDTAVDNDVEKYIRLKKLYDLWRNKNARGQVAWTSGDLKDFATSTDPMLQTNNLVTYILKLFNTPVSDPPTDANIAFATTEINKLVNKEFYTDGGINEGRLREDSTCLSAQLLCDLKASREKVCIPNSSGCAGAKDFNKYCTAVDQIVTGNVKPNTLPVLDPNNLPTTPTTTSAAAGTTTGAAASAGTSTTTTTAVTSAGTTSTTSASLASAVVGAGLPGAESGGAGAPLPPAATGGSAQSASNAALQAKLTQYTIPSYLDRGTQELLVFVFDKLAASYNFDDEDVPDDIKQAISQLSPSGKANLCARYCQLTSRCNGICKLASCLNCQVGTGSQAGSDVDGASDTSLGYAGVDDDYNLLGFLDDISQGGHNTGYGSGSGSGSDTGGKDQYKHMGPMISQKDTSGVSNIFAPYIIMAPKKDGSSYGAYLLDDPNDPGYQQYINDLAKSY